MIRVLFLGISWPLPKSCLLSDLGWRISFASCSNCLDDLPKSWGQERTDTKFLNWRSETKNYVLMMFCHTFIEHIAMKKLIHTWPTVHFHIVYPVVSFIFYNDLYLFVTCSPHFILIYCLFLYMYIYLSINKIMRWSFFVSCIFDYQFILQIQLSYGKWKDLFLLKLSNTNTFLN